MKIRNPAGRECLHIGRRDRVLEIGPGHNPSRRADVLAEKFLDDDYHRCGGVRIYPHQELVNAAGEALPFADRSFDYVICNQVLEHSDDPARFMDEMARVARGGYIETPSLMGEWLFPKRSHRWVVLELEGRLVFYDKRRVPGNFASDFGELFLNYLPYQSLPGKLLTVTERNLLHIRYEWRDGIDYLIDPVEPRFSRFFLEKWDRDMVETLFPPRSTSAEIGRTLRAAWRLLADKARRRPAPLTLEAYRALRTAKQ